jgi:hypothetical protein
MTTFWIFFWIVIAGAAPTLLYFVGSKNKIVKIGLQVILLAAIIFLSKSLYDGIMSPIRFENEKTTRYKAAVQELIQIRKAQEAFKRENGKFTPSFEKLIEFVKHDSLTVVVAIGAVDDSIFEKPEINFDRIKAEKYALDKGYIKRDSVKVCVIDSLFKGFDIETLGQVPFQKGKMFKMDTATVSMSGIPVPVFEASVTNKVLLDGLDKQLIINLNETEIQLERFPGLRAGLLESSNNNEGNWSKEYELK